MKDSTLTLALCGLFFCGAVTGASALLIAQQHHPAVSSAAPRPCLSIFVPSRHPWQVEKVGTWIPTTEAR